MNRKITAKWKTYLKKIGKKEGNQDTFIDNIKKFIEMRTKNGNAVDLGCGAGRDTIFLIKNNLFVEVVESALGKELLVN